MNECRVTVFTPTYNRDKYISNLFESLCVQNVLPCEWIIVDQGNDGTKELVNSFTKNETVDPSFIAPNFPDKINGTLDQHSILPLI